MNENMEGHRKQLIFQIIFSCFQSKALYDLTAVSCPWMPKRLPTMSLNKFHLVQASLISIPYNQRSLNTMCYWASISRFSILIKIIRKIIFKVFMEWLNAHGN